MSDTESDSDLTQSEGPQAQRLPVGEYAVCLSEVAVVITRGGNRALVFSMKVINSDIPRVLEFYQEEYHHVVVFRAESMTGNNAAVSQLQSIMRAAPDTQEGINRVMNGDDYSVFPVNTTVRVTVSEQKMKSGRTFHLTRFSSTRPTSILEAVLAGMGIVKGSRKWISSGDDGKLATPPPQTEAVAIEVMSYRRDIDFDDE